MSVSFLRPALLLLLVILWQGSARADPVVAGEEHCVVNVRSSDALNVRERPAANSKVVTAKRYDSCGIVVSGPCRNGWCRVEDGHDRGWVNRRFIAMVSPSIYCVTGVAEGDALNLRAWPSPRSRVLHRLPRRQCDIAFLPYAVGDWQKVRAGGWQGWVNRRYLSGQ